MLGLEYRIKDLESGDKDVSLSLSHEHLLDALAELLPDAAPDSTSDDSSTNLAGCKVDLIAHLCKHSSVVQCDGWLRGQLILPCQRCLEPAHLPIEVRLHTVYTPGIQAASEDRQGSDDVLDDDDIDYAHHDGEVVDLWPLVRETLILAVPITVQCKEDCRGLCPMCGVDRNTTSCTCQPAASLSPLAALRNVRLPT